MEQRRRRRKVIAGGSVAFVALYAVGGVVMVPWVQDDLTDRVEAAATEAGYTGITADFSGQDGTLSCAKPIDAPDDLIRLAEDRWGVRVAELDAACTAAAGSSGDVGATTTVAVSTTAPATTTAPAATTTTAAVTTTAASTTTTTVAVAEAGLNASAVVSPGSSTVTLTGTVETEEQRAALVAAATAAFGEGNVVDQLEVLGTDALSDDAADGLAALIGSMNPNLVEGTASYDGTKLALTGVYVSAEAQSTVTAAATAAGVASDDLALTPRAEASVDQAAQLEAALNAAVGTTPIPFATGSSELGDDAGPILDQVAALARAYAGVSVAVNGHTDSDGSDSGNLALSQSRAASVRDALIERGVPADQLVAQGFGETDPVAPNDTPANKALNRRVVFAVVTQ